MNRDHRDLTFSGTGTGSIGQATVELRTQFIDVANIVGPVTALGSVGAHASLSGTLALEHATTATGGSVAVVTGEDDFPGGRAANGANATGGNDIAAGGGEAALSYNGTRRYVRGRLTIRRSGNATVTSECSLVLIGQPRISPNR